MEKGVKGGEVKEKGVWEEKEGKGRLMYRLYFYTAFDDLATESVAHEAGGVQYVSLSDNMAVVTVCRTISTTLQAG